MVAKIVARLIGGAVLATGGWRLGEYISDVWGAELFVPVVFGLGIGGMVLGLLATPYMTVRSARNVVSQIETIPTSRVLSGVLGTVLGLLVALLVSIPLFRMPGWIGYGAPTALSIFFAYLGGFVMSRPQRDVFQRIVPSTLAQATLDGKSQLITNHLLDTSAIIDGRIADVAETGFIQGTLVVPSFILDELRHIADSSDSLRRARGRRGLDILNKLRQESDVPIQVLDVPYDHRNGMEVDARLVEIAKEIHGSIVTTDYNLNRVAQMHGVPVLNVNELAGSLKPVVLPGEELRIKVVQEGKEPGQGVGFLDDGTMVVVEGGNRHLNKDIEVSVTRMLQTAAGSIIFAQAKRS